MHRLLFLSYAVLILLVIFLTQEMLNLREQVYALEKENHKKDYQIHILSEEIDVVREEKQRYSEKLYKAEEKVSSLEKALESTFGFEAEVTAYAPLDPEAEEGMCYAGDPTVTASGEPVEPGVTVAAGELPFGSRVWIEGIGWREVQDRGGAIGEKDIDVAVECREEALRFGRQKRRAITLEGGEE